MNRKSGIDMSIFELADRLDLRNKNLTFKVCYFIYKKQLTFKIFVFDFFIKIFDFAVDLYPCISTLFETIQKFGKLTVVRIEVGKNGKGHKTPICVCKCECGNSKSIRKTSLTLKKHPTRSCGCIQKQIAHNTGNKTIAENSKRQIETNMAYHTNCK